MVDWLFDRFSIIWDKKWTDKIDGVEKQKREVWANAIAGMTRQQLDIGVKNASRQLIWPPEIAEFIKLCTDEKFEQPVLRNDRCIVPGCSNLGTISRELRGDRWICRQHYHENKY